MTVEQAIMRFKTKFIDYRIISYKDLGDMYIFEAVSPAFDAMPEPKTAMDPWYFVDKETGLTNHFNPFLFDPKEFFRAERYQL